MHVLDKIAPSQSLTRLASESIPPFGSGVLLLSCTHDLLYITPNASRMLRHLTQFGTQMRSGNDLPMIVHDICDEIERARQLCTSPLEWAAVQAHRIVLTMPHPMTLRGFVVPEGSSPPTNRVLIILEFIATPPEPSASPTISRFHLSLTPRQAAIAQGLMRGLTNKELANELGLSAHTVKEYVRAIMIKVQATTRAGAVARLVGIPQANSVVQDLSQSGRHSSSPR